MRDINLQDSYSFANFPLSSLLLKERGKLSKLLRTVPIEVYIGRDPHFVGSRQSQLP
jgi:hypothetical protein